ncbi:MAG TPA: glycoside hydrolase family 2 TIM barrel-domain containing protein [Verrucomicrobiae bacterium]|nr:glycoside hydrolase family 2 TIM barrel-domain containing protein [Verrucomicrobiae bacterium]
MRQFRPFVLFVAAWLLLPPAVIAANVRVIEPFDTDWYFFKGDPPDAEQVNFSDAGWSKLDVPHDWSIEGPFAETNQTGGAGAFLPSGVGWYRKHFTLPAGEPNRRVFVEFDGVMANSDVWINGFHLGHRPYGYVSFSYNLTGHVNFGSDNVIAVRADTSQQPASRWYSGAGIYRHVRLVETTHVYVPQGGLFLSTPEVTDARATVQAQVTVTNEYSTPIDVFLNLSVVGPDGKIVGTAQTPLQTITNASSEQFNQDIFVKNPQRWDLDHPVLYQARVDVCGPPVEADPEPMPLEVTSARSQTSRATVATAPFKSWGSMYDNAAVSFGIREFHFDAATGFWLNGKNFKIKGVCLHQDGGAFGAAVPLGVWRERLQTLKELGVNAIRTAHNPPAPDFLDLCDRMGFLVMDEMFDCWTVGKNPCDYHLYFNEWSQTDEHETILRDRNHPSIILYSVGNEIHDTPKAGLAKSILQGLVAVAHETDPTRPVTQALFRPNASHDYDDGLADMLDVIGQNYRENEILAAHAQNPKRKIIGTENQHSRVAWLALRDHPPYAGQFLWSGIDYLGESRRWPVIAAGSGLLDRTGAPRPMACERASWWLAGSKPADTNTISPPSRSALRRGGLRPREAAGEDRWSDKPMVFITRRIAPNTLRPTDPGYEPASQDVLRRPQVLFADWTPKDLQPHDETVEVYSNCQEVELFLNGKSLGTQPLHADAAPRVWKVNFAPGTLKAVARNDGKEVATDELRTAGQPAKIRLTTNLKKLDADWDDVAFVRAAVVDRHGVPVPSAKNLIRFKISGPGLIVAVDNADNASHEPFQASERHAFEGKCVAFVKARAASGQISITASSPGLEGGEVVIPARKATD